MEIFEKPKLERLDKILSNNGCGTRTEVKKIIKSGCVFVDDDIVKSPDTKVDVSSKIIVNGKLIKSCEFTYIMMNKPAGVLSATSDNNQQTVLDLIPKQLIRAGLFPVGRLDKDTTGLLLITNDGKLAHSLLSPKHHVTKRYYVECDVPFLNEEIELFSKGIIINNDYLCKSAILEIDDNRNAVLTITEGKFHQIKKMCEAIEKKVLLLNRIAMGPLLLDNDLSQGEVRLLTTNEIESLEEYKKQ